MSPATREKLIDRLYAEARALGFDAIGISSASLDPSIADNLAAFVKAGNHGTMEWMRETLERRSDPKTLWPEAKSIVVLAMNYGPETNPLEALERRSEGVLSVYARHRDYHDVIKGKLKTLAAKLVSHARRENGPVDVKVFVDTAPVMEKPLAAAAGIGWQGKHTNLVSREFGSWLFLGSIFTTLDLATDEPEIDHCGSCRACLDVCPTDAFPAPYRIDARRCISYLTIEHKGPIDHALRPLMGNRIYGCDDCLAVCPWNKFAQTAREAKLASPPEPLSNDLRELLALDDTAFRTRFASSPVKRIGRARFIRNCLIAAGNSGDPSLASPAGKLAADPDPLVRGAAVWAMRRLVPDRAAAYRDINETDAVVIAEWEADL